MPEVYSKALDKSVTVDRIIGELHGTSKGPTIVFFAGIHGNEPAGIFALKQVLDKVKDMPLFGHVYAVAGHLWALEKGVRYDKQDLNRLWTVDLIADLWAEKSGESEDTKQQRDIFKVVGAILKKETGPFYFVDLHTTSSESIPFLTVNDSLLNRKYAMQYPAPMILGVEEYLEGPLLSYLNERGYVSFGFEGGQHDSREAIDNHVAFIYLTLAYTGVASAVPVKEYYQKLAATAESSASVFEIYFRYNIEDDEDFVMMPGFVNFQRYQKGMTLATSNGKPIVAEANGRILMPRYQGKGNDGYFLIRRTPTFFFWLSAILRKLKLDHLLPLLPGVQWVKEGRDILIVDKRVARFLAKSFFHLMGYRTRQLDGDHLIVKNRESVALKEDYRGAPWR
jgi:predicted deacylase